MAFTHKTGIELALTTTSHTTVLCFLLVYIGLISCHSHQVAVIIIIVIMNAIVHCIAHYSALWQIPSAYSKNFTTPPDVFLN